jgi:hypothetical protein
MNPLLELPAALETLLSTMQVSVDDRATVDNIFACGVRYVAVGHLLMGWAMYKLRATLPIKQYHTKREELTSKYGITAEDVEYYREGYSSIPDVLYTLLNENGIPNNFTFHQFVGMAAALRDKTMPITSQTDRNAPDYVFYLTHVKKINSKKRWVRPKLALPILRHRLSFDRGHNYIFVNANASIEEVII